MNNRSEVISTLQKRAVINDTLPNGKPCKTDERRSIIVAADGSMTWLSCMDGYVHFEGVDHYMQSLCTETKVSSWSGEVWPGVPQEKIDAIRAFGVAAHQLHNQFTAQASEDYWARKDAEWLANYGPIDPTPENAKAIMGRIEVED